jgi:diguanylate cyclase (GGDEF)-like protein
MRVQAEPADTGVREEHTSRRVLVVDDDPTFVLLSTEALQKAGFEVRGAGSAKEAAAAWDEFKPHLVLLDVDLPWGNGFDICRAIRSAEVNSDVPVVMVTGLEDSDSINRAYEVGATDFMHKPVLWPTLAHRVDFILRAHEDRDRLTRSEQKNRALLQALPDASVIVDPRGVIREHLSGADTTDNRSLLGKTLEEAFPPPVAAEARRSLSEGPSGGRLSHEFAVGQGAAQRWFEARLRPQTDGTLLIVMRDTTERRKARERVEYLAYFDVLTHLPNRTLFLRQAARSLEEAQRTGALLALLYLDLDRFKRVNDNLGHAAGDSLLKQVARRLEQLLAPGAADSPLPAHPLNTIARLGGDEFVVLANGLSGERQAADVAERIRQLLAEPFTLGHHTLVVTPSIGAAIFPRDATQVDDLLVNADMAMYMAKDRGRNGYAFFGQSVAVRSLGRLEIETDMRQALEAGQFSLAYQPKLDLLSGAITGVEALLRWNHPERGPIPPDRFIPVAEESGLIVPLGAWVVEQVCAQLERWTRMGIGQLTAAVNVSVQQFERADFVDSVLRTLEQHGLDAKHLELEITESLLSRNVKQTTAAMRRLRSHGVALAIDDFGTGYSSLGYLRQLPVSSLKIDRSFVKDLDRSEDAAAICTAIIALAREMKLQVVAEGVENIQQFAFLQRHRCDQAQGYLISRPVSAADIVVLLRDGLAVGQQLLQAVQRHEAASRQDVAATGGKGRAAAAAGGAA